MATPKEAQEVVTKLTKKYGYLRPELLEKLGELNAEYLEELEEYKATTEKAISHSIKTLARTVYDSNARFIFELLQNADDNKFTEAAKKRRAPGITFKLWPDKIIIDCNEDGFTTKDLEAICSIGQSSKTISHGYIGAKGIGFKSVFMVASKVHIQSGHFSFEFLHRREDPGIGMVRPFWKTPDQTLDGPMTRMTLWLHSDGDAAETAHQRDVIDRQFKDLEVACLLFLRNLREITVERYDDSDVLAESRKFTKSGPIGRHRSGQSGQSGQSEDYNDSDEAEDYDNSEAFRNLNFSQDSEGSEYSWQSDSSGRVVILSTIQLQKLCNLYTAIYAKLVLSKDPTQDRINIEELFDEDVIYIPDEDAPYWVGRSQCRWHGPPLTTIDVLHNLYGRTLGDEQMTSLGLLFSKTLMIPDVSAEDIIEELKLIRDDWVMDPDEPSLNSIKELYRYLHESENCDSSAYSDGFRSEGLIYARSGGTWGWYKSSDCLWSSRTNIEGKAVLNTHYEEFEDFFVGCLGVKSLTLEMVYDELSRTRSQDVTDIKSKILVFASLLAAEPTDLEPAPILEASVFPLKYPDNPAVKLVKGNIDFAIADRDYLRQRFQGRAKILDLTLEQVRRASPFFEWLNFQGRYLSKRLKEITSVGAVSGVVVSSATQAMQRKAKYLLRIAATFESPRYENDNVGLLQQLHSVSVIETDTLSTTLSIIQDNRPISVESETGSVHIAETADSMTIYVPKDKRARAICFASVLPAAYADWLMLDPTNNRQGIVTEDMIPTLMSVFACPASALDTVLDRCGICKASSFSDIDDSSETEYEDSCEDDYEDDGKDDYEDDGEDDHQDDGEGSDASHTLTPNTGLEAGQRNNAPGFPRASSRQDSLSERSETVGRDAHENGVQSSSQTVLNVEHASSSISQQRHSPSLTARVHQPVLGHPSTASNSRLSMSPYLGAGLDSHGQYEILLQRVVDAARSRSSQFPQVTALNMQVLADALPGGDDDVDVESYDRAGVNIRVGSMSRLERDKRVGAAGELYVYELLFKENLPGWGRDNWQSRIRTYARAHPDYALLEAWTRSETSDLVYDDSQGHLTEKLINWGYLEAEKWQHACPKYYLEVKTTTGPCETPFYASGKQYRLQRPRRRFT
ncbi:ATPase-like, ATP-binding domain protein [Cordyceps fumosorosea ARSEF 2679]|uniref:ATPase-like, ATP-binding domain protein n=1 Tax=Cordyceps fumosorosea (strain ARSEF 2679) TaxID=1081104 RepID=A0A167MX35_CORFA|nr:ATPase-like, ATP-binding domain protein [Cordyceps fumosorosea ARSEF 2679]OAA54856.1 ATPase-like, ATP-binding domain protein [Cordyceps fumosorosea ARSEF 2679]